MWIDNGDEAVHSDRMNRTHMPLTVVVVAALVVAAFVVAIVGACRRDRGVDRVEGWRLDRESETECENDCVTLTDLSLQIEPPHSLLQTPHDHDTKEWRSTIHTHIRTHTALAASYSPLLHCSLIRRS